MLRVMDPVHATIEEFAADGYTHVELLLPVTSRDQAAADQLASPHRSGPHHRAGFAVWSAAIRFTRSSACDWRTRSEVALRDGDIDCLVRDMHKPELAPASGILPEQNIFATGRAKNLRSEEQPIKREGVLVKGALSQPTGEPPN